jgi:hypothetical protein
MDDSSKSDAPVSILVSGGSWTRLLKGDSSAVTEVEESTDDYPFVSAARTLAAAPLLYGYTAQVHEQGIRYKQKYIVCTPIQRTVHVECCCG